MGNWDTTIIVSGLKKVPVRRYTVSPAFFGVVCGGLTVFLTLTGLSTFHYYRMWQRSADYEVLQSKFETLHRSTEDVRLQARQLSERLSSFEVSTQKLRVVTGLNEEGLGGVGGPDLTGSLELSFDERSLFDQLNSLDKRTISLSQELRKFQEYYKDRQILLSSTPSIMPVTGYPSDRYGTRRDPFTRKSAFHPGIDISSPVGAKVVATADGVVAFAGRQVNYGKLVKIQHRFGVGTRYGHLKQIVVEKGQHLKKGDVIGYVGATGRATGPHVHYEVRLNGRALNPLRFLREED